MSIAIVQWIKKNSVILVNTGSLVGTMLITSVLGFAYWWVAARYFPTAEVGLASAATSAMMLLSTFFLLGQGTLLISELPRNKGKEGSIISASTLLVGGASLLGGLIFAFVAPFISPELSFLGTNPLNILLFAFGVSLAAVTFILDQAIIGLLQGGLQLWRNALFAISKLVLLIMIGQYLAQQSGISIYTTWTIGNLLSLLPVLFFLIKRNKLSIKNYIPEWGMMRKFGSSAFQHHILNLILQAPTQILPLLVTILLSAQMNASYYIASMIANFVASLSLSLTTVLHATNAAQASTLTQKARLTIGLSLLASLTIGLVLMFGAGPILYFFGPTYAENATTTLRILLISSIPLTVKNHYIAICRIKDHIRQATVPVTVGAILELIVASIGAKLGGLSGLSLGWVIALSVEAVIMLPVVITTLKGRSAIDRYLDEIAFTETMLLPALDQFRATGSIQLITMGSTTVLTEVNTMRLPAMRVNSSKRVDTKIFENADMNIYREEDKVAMSKNNEHGENPSPSTIRVKKLPLKKAPHSPDMPTFSAMDQKKDQASLSSAAGQPVEIVQLDFADVQSSFPEPLERTAPTNDKEQKPYHRGGDYLLTKEELVEAKTVYMPSISKEESPPPVPKGYLLTKEELVEASTMHMPSIEDAKKKIDEIGTIALAPVKSEPTHRQKSPPLVDETEEKALEKADQKRAVADSPTMVMAVSSIIAGQKKVAALDEEPDSSNGKSNLWLDIALYLAPVAAFIVWCISLQGTHIGNINDLGLVSLFSPALIGALAIMSVSFCLELRRPKVRYLNLCLHFGLIIFMLYGVNNLIEEMPRFFIVYRHTGYTEYIMRTGTVDPNLDAYFCWPGFFALSAFLTKIAGYPDVLSFAAWAPVFYNILYFGPLFMFFSAFTKNKRVVWLAIWLFYLTNWIGQDYFSPQGYNFFLYLVIIAILVRWFKVSPETKVRPLGPRLRKIPFAEPFYAWLRAPDALIEPSEKKQRQGLVACIIIIFAFVVFSHQLTPFFLILGVGALIICRRIRLWWLLPLMILMTMTWVFTMASPYIVGHQDQVFGSLGRILSSFTENVSNRVAGNPEHTFIARFRIIMSMFIWGSAFIAGVVRYRKGYKDVTIALLCVMPFPLFIVQPYGGEMLLRSYLFSLPAMLFLISSFFYSVQWMNKGYWRVATHCALCLFLLGGFLFTRYGNESMDYMTTNEIAGVRKLYSIAPNKSSFLAAWTGTPWQIQDFEKFPLYIIGDTTAEGAQLSDGVKRQNVAVIARFLQEHSTPKSYLIFTRSNKRTFDVTSGMPAGTLDAFEQKVAKSGNFILVYSNPDAQIFQFVGTVGDN